MVILAHEFADAYLSKIGWHSEGNEGDPSADAFAGGFAHYVEQRDLLELSEVRKAHATFTAFVVYEVSLPRSPLNPLRSSQALKTNACRDSGCQISGKVSLQAISSPDRATGPASSPTYSRKDI